MKTTLVRSFLLIAGLVMSSLALSAAVNPNMAVVLDVTGTATALSIGDSQARPLKVGDKLPQGTTITTSAGAEVEIETFPGSVTTIAESSTVNLETLTIETNNSGAVTRQTSLIDIKSGSVVGIIDPAKKDINDYGLRTPEGVAAARGTSVVAKVNGRDVTITATADSVTYKIGNNTVTIKQGEAYFGGQKIALSSLAGNNSPEAQAIKSLVSTGLKAMEKALEKGSIQNADSANDLAAKVLAVSNATDPSKAEDNTSKIIDAMTKPGTKAKNNTVEDVKKVLDIGTQNIPQKDRDAAIDAGQATAAKNTGLPPATFEPPQDNPAPPNPVTTPNEQNNNSPTSTGTQSNTTPPPT